jgi:DnaJ-like protein
VSRDEKMSSSHRESPLNADLPRWESWVEKAISEAQERGDFDNLPGRGEPLVIEENREAGDWEMGYHLLKNAEMSPPWMELNREVQAEAAALAAIRERYCRSQVADVALPATPIPNSRPWWAFWRSTPAPPVDPDPALVREARDAEGRQARRAYLAQAARLDEVLAAYNAWLPNDLRRLTRPRMTPARAVREFEAPCPK